LKYLRFQKPDTNQWSWGIIENGTMIEEFSNSYFNSLGKNGLSHQLTQVKLGSPTLPTKIVAVGLNYHDHIQEFGHEVPDHPILFIKPSTAVLEPGGTILLPPQSNQVDFEGELAVVIKQTAYQITVQAAPNYILGYTCFNDVTARDLQRIDGQWTRAKSFDTFAPIGPWITPELNPDSLQIITRVNGTIRQQSNTKHLVFPIYELVSFISHIMTLLPGDIIATGTPSGVGPLKPGDRVDIEIEGIGILTNLVRKA
jgi:2-keto-4-pentenoate hydratase/2-oxohepta-3-ene-1,7-dioic acid hydratase in catechol pathway